MTMYDPTPADRPPEGQILIYRDGAIHLQVRLDGQTVWLPQRLIAELFQVSVPTVNEHLGNIYEDGELVPEATIRKFRIVQTEGARQVSRLLDHYSLDVILAVGYRVRSQRGTQFRQWATARLGELLVKGFTLDDQPSPFPVFVRWSQPSDAPPRPSQVVGIPDFGELSRAAPRCAVARADG